MPSFNQLTLVGNLTKDPEIRYIQSGACVCKFTLAVNNPVKKEEVLFIQCTAWERLAETCNTYLAKGDPCLVSGRLVVRQYQDKDDVQRTAVECNVLSMQMLGNKRDGGTGEFAPRSSSAPSTGGDTIDDLEDEIPF